MPADPPFWEQWLLINPWPVGLGLLVIGGLLAFNALRRQSRRDLWLGLAGAAAGVGVLLAANLVTLPRQQLAARTRELMNLTAPLDMARLKTMFEPDAPLLGPRGDVWIQGKNLLPVIESSLKRWRILGQTIVEVRAQVYPAAAGNAGTGVSAVRLRTAFQDSPYERGTATTWLIQWHAGNDGVWRVTSIQWLKWEGQEPAEGNVARAMKMVRQ